ncbi:MAG: helix-turn-helix domain-containing protein [Chloroflexi bacterium]|nr:helix-turn-helix domain-containing protein [Chloroflexota bacterium]
MVVDSKDLITVREAARAVGRTTETVRRWIWAGKLPAQKLGNQLFVRRADLALFVSTQQGRRSASQGDVLQRMKAIRERIARRIGGTIDVLAALDESRASHPEYYREPPAR